MTTNLGTWAEDVVAGAPSLGAVKRSVENELLAMSALVVVHKSTLLPPEAVFIGGTALRLCYSSPRFSEDLDFHLPPAVAYDGMDEAALAKELGTFVGADIATSRPSTSSSSTLVRMSAILPDRNKDIRRPRTKIDMAKKQQVDVADTIIMFRMGGGLPVGMGDLADPISRRVSSKREILVDKHLALVGRARRIKQRDLFDIMWLHHQGVEFDADLLAAKLARDDRPAFIAALKQRVAESEQALLGGAYDEEMRRFLPVDSAWLFEGRQQVEMAGGLRTLLNDNTEKAARHLGRTVVGTPSAL